MEKLKKLIKKNKFIYFAACAAYEMKSLLTSLFFVINRVHKIDSKKIVCCNTKGVNYGDNPKYIIDELLKICPGEYDIVWLLNDNYRGDLPSNIRRVRHGSLEAIKEMATARIWIDSNMKSNGTLKRKGQFFIQTWHGSYGIKKICYDIPEKLSYIDKRDINCNSRITDLFISNSRAYTKIYKRSMRYKGKVVEYGSPRNDMLFEKTEDVARKVRNFYSLKDEKILLYAPTYRDNYETHMLHVNFDSLLAELSKKYGGKWVVLVRLHPKNIESSETFMKYSDEIINASRYGVMQELLAAADFLLTDYSSCMLDYLNLRRPCVLYAPDMMCYHNDRGFYYDMYDLPFPIATNQDELNACVADFDGISYERKIEELEKQVGLKESGQASKLAAELIVGLMNGQEIKDETE